MGLRGGLAAVAAWVGAAWVGGTGCAGRSALPIDGRLAPCPRSPNCVSSQAAAKDIEHFVPPLDLVGDPGTAASRVLVVARSVRGAGEGIVAGDAIRIVFHTPSGLFRDDVDLVVDREAGVIHVRSASRVGYGDLGVNRKRVEALRAAWIEATVDDR